MFGLGLTARERFVREELVAEARTVLAKLDRVLDKLLSAPMSERASPLAELASGLGTALFAGRPEVKPESKAIATS